MTSRLARRVALLCAAAAGLCALPAAAAPPLPDTPIFFAVDDYPADTGRLFGVRPDGGDLTEYAFPPTDLLYASTGIDPSATRVLYMRPIPRTDITQPQWRFEIRTANLDGSDSRLLFFNESGNVTQQRWSPDGSRIAFIREIRPGLFGGNGFSLYTMNADGSGLTEIDRKDPSEFTFTPNGQAIVYRGVIYDSAELPPGCTVPAPTAAWIRFDLQTGARSVISPCGPIAIPLDAGRLEFTPAGDAVYLTFDNVERDNEEPRNIQVRRIWITAPGSAPPRLVDEQIERIDDWWIAGEPAFSVSPDGQWIVISRVFNDFSDRDLAVVSLEDGTAFPIPGTKMWARTPMWAPNLELSSAPPDGDGDGVPESSDNCPTTANPGQEDTDGDGAGDLCDTDLDNDGIDNAIDTGLDTFADDNAPVITEGTIVDRAGLNVTVTDVAAPEGVRIVVGSGTGKARFQVCQGFTIRVAAGSEVVVTCGSVKLGVVDGEAEIVLGDASTIVTVPEGGTAKVDTTGTDTYTVQNTGTVPVSVTVDGTTASVPAGTTAPVATWNFTGFNAPVDNPPVVNLVKAGRAIPLKWRITRSDGTPVTNLTTATITTVRNSCITGATTDEVEETTAGGSSLLNQGSGNYQLNWKSQTSHAGTCRELRLDIGDGVRHTALFRFN